MQDSNNESSDPSEHEPDARQSDEGDGGSVGVFVVLGQAAAAIDPGDGPFHMPEWGEKGVFGMRDGQFSRADYVVLLRKSGEHLLKQEVFYGARNQVYDGVQARGGAPSAEQWPAAD